MRVKEHYMDQASELDQLHIAHEKAFARCMALTPQSGAVGNCISDSEHRTDAWRHLKDIEFQINQLKASK